MNPLAMKLLVGSANSGKTQSVLARLAQAVSEKQQRVWLIVPSLAAAEVLTEPLTSRLSNHSLVSRGFASVTFPNLFEKVWRLTGEPRAPLSAIERHHLLRNVIAGLAQENLFTYFDKIAGKTGLVSSLASFIDELWRSNVTADDFAHLSQNPSTKDADFVRIFKGYELALNSARVIDGEGAGVYAIRALENLLRDAKANQGLLQKIADEFALVACDGFDFYTPTQIRLLRLLSDCGVEALATLTYEADRAVHLWQQRTRERFSEAGAEIVNFASPSPTHLRQAAALLMRDEAPATLAETPASAIQIISAPDRAAEVRAIAREIKRLVLEEGLALNDITIVCRTLATYAHHFERVFDECAIPLALDNQLALGENPCVIALLRLLQLAGTGFPRQAVIASLRSPYFDFSAFDLNDTMVDLLDSLSLELHVMQGRGQWQAIAEPAKIQSDEERARAKAEEAAGDAPATPLRSGLAEKLNRFFQAVSFSQTASRIDYARRVQTLVSDLQVDQRASQGRTVDRDKPALQIFLDLLQSLSQEDKLTNAGPAASASEVTWEGFIDELQRACQAASCARPPAPPGSVVVQEAHNLRPRAYRAMFVSGLIEGEFPKKSAETTPYTLAEREHLRGAGLDLAETTNDAGADLTVFHKALTRTAERCYLSYARTDFAGGELLKSYLIEEVSAVARTEPWYLGQHEMPDARNLGDAASLEELALKTARAMRESDQELSDFAIQARSLLAAQLKSWATTQRAVSVERRRLSGNERGSFGGFIADRKLAAIIQQKFGEDYLWSASKINDYGLCPYRFFARNVLRLSERREPTESFTADRLGTAYHEILERSFRALKEQGLELSESSLAEAIALVEQASEAVLAEMLEKREIRQGGLWEFDKREIKKRVVNLLRAEIEWHAERPATPVAFEQKFGMGGKPPLVLTSLSGKIKIRGQIDRIDEQDGELTVIDYKTGRAPVSSRDAETGRNLQLPIYLMAADRVMMRDKPVASGYYLHITSCKKGSPFPSKAVSLDDLKEQAERYIHEYVNAVRRAEFPIQPNQNRCPPCEFATMCRIQSLGTSADDE